MTTFEIISVIVALIAIPSFFYGIYKVLNKNMESLIERRKHRENYSNHTIIRRGDNNSDDIEMQEKKITLHTH